jgi:folate-binding protein YgfZ
MNTQNVYILEDRGILYINGTDAKEFLQNLISNDINKVDEKNSCFSSLLSPQGKFLFEFLIVQHKSGFFLDCEKDQIEDLFRQLNIYKLRSKVEILNLSNEFVVAAFSNEKFRTFENSKDIEGHTIKYREDPILLDPRNKNLGARLIINLEKLYLSLKKLELKTSEQKDYYDHSFKLGILQQSTKKLQNKVFSLEANFEELNAIDFKKGCYVGQENTARMKLKNKIRKRLFPIETQKKLEEGSEIFYNEKPIGKILISEPHPFALINLFSPDFQEFCDKELVCNYNKIRINKVNFS